MNQLTVGAIINRPQKQNQAQNGIRNRLQNGITLISLVVTIIILLILAGVTLSLISGSEGILSRATNSVDKTNIEAAKEQVTLKIQEYQEEFYEGKYVTYEIDNATKQGDWIYESYGGGTTTDYKFKITEKEIAGDEKTYEVVIEAGRNLEVDVIGSLSADGELEWEPEGIVKRYLDKLLSSIQKENGGTLTLQKLYETLENKNADIILDQYQEGDTQLRGTYELNGKKYQFSVDGNLNPKVEGPEPEIVSIEKIVWENGKPKVILTNKIAGEIEYQINGEEGSWQKGSEVNDLNLGDTLCVRVNDGTNVSTVQKFKIKDKEKPASFEIEVSEVKGSNLTINLKTESKDDETGLRGYTFVVEKDGNKIQVEDKMETTQKITGLEPTTSYKVYVIAYDKAGNSTKSNEIEVTTTEMVAVTVSTPSTAGGYRAGNQLPFNWEQLSEIASGIANNAGTITNNTREFRLTYQDQDYTIGVGDWTTVNGKKVRIIGFNHDELVDKTVYDGTHTYAGISFEYAEFITTAYFGNYYNENGVQKINETMRTTLNGSTYNGIKNTVNVKKVKKAYCANTKGTPISYYEDYLWLLSCAEIWNNGTLGAKRGMTNAIEGIQYKFYKNINANCQNTNNYLRKGGRWWTRSLYSQSGAYKATVNTDGRATQSLICETRERSSPRIFNLMFESRFNQLFYRKVTPQFNKIEKGCQNFGILFQFSTISLEKTTKIIYNIQKTERKKWNYYRQSAILIT